MARPIKETPTLYGEDAKRFAAAIASTQPVSEREMQNIEQSYQRIMSMANFAF